MRKQELQKGELDQIGRKLLRATQISDEEIEQIVAPPQLFDAVKIRIKTEQRKSKNYSDNWRSSWLWNRQRISAVSAAFGLFVLGAFSFVLIIKSLQIDEQAELVPAIQTDSETIAPISEHFPEIEAANNPETKPLLIAKKKTFQKETVKKSKPERKAPSVKRPKQSNIELLRDFYALNYMGNPNETGEALRIVRAELSPSALFAL